MPNLDVRALSRKANNGIDDDEPFGPTDVGRRTFTSMKLDWMDSCIFKRPAAFKVGYIIAQYVDHRTSRTPPLSDATIAEEAECSVSKAKRDRWQLRDDGLLDWRRTNTANVYSMISDKLEGILDEREARREQRRQQYANTAAAASRRGPVTQSPLSKGRGRPPGQSECVDR
jgi:hypothetical protein